MTPRTEHMIQTYATAFGFGWTCACGNKSRSVGAYPTQTAAYSGGERHIRTERKRSNVTAPIYDKQNWLDVVENESARMKTALAAAASAGATRREVAKVMNLPTAIVGQIVFRWGIEMETM